MILVSTHNICFYEEICIIIPKLSLNTYLIHFPILTVTSCFINSINSLVATSLCTEEPQFFMHDSNTYSKQNKAGINVTGLKPNFHNENQHSKENQVIVLISLWNFSNHNNQTWYYLVTRLYYMQRCFDSIKITQKFVTLNSFMTACFSIKCSAALNSTFFSAFYRVGD